jgi:hypothetical protein
MKTTTTIILALVLLTGSTGAQMRPNSLTYRSVS